MRLFASVPVAALAIGCAASPAFAQLGSEFRANTYTSGAQRHAAVAASAGSFLVAWESPQDGSSYGIYAQRFTSASKPVPLGGEVLLNTSTPGAQRYPAAAVDGSGNFVVVWQSSPAGTATNVYGQRISSSGVPLGSEFRVNTYTGPGYVLRRPGVAADSDGSFVVVWVAYAPSSQTIAGQRYSSAGAPVGGEFRVSTSTAPPDFPAVAYTGGGSFVVAWNEGLYGFSDVRAQRYDGTGAKAGNEFRVNSYTTDPRDREPSIASDSAGNFTVVWRGEAVPASNGDIFGQRFSSAGAAIGGEFRVNGVTTGDQEHPKIASDASGNLTVVWERTGPTSNTFGQRFASSGAPLGGEFLLETSTPETTHTFPAVAASGPAFVVAWSSKYDGSGLTGDYGIFGKHYPGGGDINGDGKVDVADVFYLINFLFASGPGPIGPADVNGDGSANVIDVFALINYLFAGGPAPK